MASTMQTKRLKLASGGVSCESEPANTRRQQQQQQKKESCSDAARDEYLINELIGTTNSNNTNDVEPNGGNKSSTAAVRSQDKKSSARATRACRQQSGAAAAQRRRETTTTQDDLGVDDLSDETDKDEDDDQDADDDDFGLEGDDQDDDDDEDDDDDDDDDEDALGTAAAKGARVKRRHKQRGAPNLQAQLAASGPAGVAAAAAIATVRKRKRPHTFETNPSVRKRQQTRLIRKLRACIDEYTARVGQQAVVLITMPGKTAHNFKVFGAQPLESVVRSCKQEIMSELEQAVLEQTPITRASRDASKHDLPPLVIDGIPTPVEKMTQAQLRAFIPLMLKYSTGRGKPGWGKDSTRPQWWPNTLPWANVRSDARDEDEKQRISWTTTLREIVTNCYKFHGREDLLPIFDESEEREAAEAAAAAAAASTEGCTAASATSNSNTNHNDTLSSSNAHNHQQQQHNHLSDGDQPNDENKLHYSQARHHHQTGGILLRSQRPLGSAASARLRNQQIQQQQQQQQQHHLLEHHSNATYYTTSAGALGGLQQGYISTSAAGADANFMQTIQNADGSVSLIQVDPANAQILTLPDGTQVRAVRLQTCLSAAAGDGGGGGGVGDDGQLSGELLPIDASQLQEHQHQQHILETGQQAELAPDGQIILTSEDGTQSCYPMSQLVSIPASVYQQLAATGQPVQIITADSAGLAAGSAIQVHTIQEISAADAAGTDADDNPACAVGESSGSELCAAQQVDAKLESELASTAKSEDGNGGEGGGDQDGGEQQVGGDTKPNGAELFSS